MSVHANKKIFSDLKSGLPQEQIDTLTGLSDEQKKQLLTGLTEDQINSLKKFLSEFAENTYNMNKKKVIGKFIKLLSNLK